VLDQLPKWGAVQPIEHEIKRRFKHIDTDELKARLDRCAAFSTKWEPERAGYDE